MSRTESRAAREALDDWRVAERALADARHGRETAGRVADSARLAAQAAKETAEAATAAMEAAVRAERSAAATAEAARLASATAELDLHDLEQDESAAAAAEEAAHGRHREASERARAAYRAADGVPTRPATAGGTMIEEVLAAWREVERILEQHRERPERDREAEARLVEQIETLRALQGSLTSGSMATTTALAQSRERIAETWELLGTTRR